ncbi:DoxX family protein [Actinomadura parmotrematis]|uniref:DoxX family protein n=1 Tax=Actinomadura parmotrematis TaxID=2864039 RepID=A0ABS7FP08_9ACTN|nr:DoxX family protein [Actinomadura parmotrematis]MBW8482113.1 DoxX family protein [Actinomadura parmotrematis]
MTAIQTPAATSSTSAGTRVLWALQILVGLFLLIGSAIPKFVGQSDAVRVIAEIGWGQWLRYVTGFFEAAGAIGLMVPRLAGAAATGLIALMIGAAVVQVTVLGSVAGAAFPLALGVLFAVVAWRRRADTLALLRR